MSVGTPKIPLNRDNEPAIQRFSEQLHELVKELSTKLKEFFLDSINGRLGEDHRNIVLKLFDEWCRRNDITPLSELYEHLLQSFNELIKLIHNANARGRLVDELVKRVAEGIKSREELVRNIINKCVVGIITEYESYELKIKSENIVQRSAWNCAVDLLEGNAIQLFLDQTAHVIIARLLVYRVLEDKSYATKRFASISKQDLLDEFIKIRRDYETLLPNIYSLSEFDWWYVPDVIRGLLSNEQQKLLSKHEDKLRANLKRILKVLTSYDFSQVDFDLWQRVYQFYLPEVERQRLGGFYTPYELVSLIIDLAGYKPERSGLCKLKVLDPAAGSGTFVVEAARRLIQHLLDPKHDCHNLPKTEWGKAKAILETVVNNIYAIDIHPFATFLTSLNLTMLLIDYYFKVWHQDRTYKLRLNVITADSLTKKVQTSILDYIANSRLKEAHKRLEDYKKALSLKFDYVFGNPPWGSVLKGPLSPLWNEKKREEYRKEYKSAYGKYDICVLFLERGIEWLKENGVLAMVVNNWFIHRDFGKGVRKVITDNSELLYLVDLGDFGKELFNAMNNPLVIIFRRVREQDDKEGKDAEQARVIVIRAFKKKGITATQVIKEVRELVKAIQEGDNKKVEELQRSKDHIKIVYISQEYFKKNVDKGWRLIDVKIVDLVDAIASLADKSIGYRLSDLFVDVQGVTTGLNEVFILSESNLNKLIKEDGIDLYSEPLLFKCLSGREVHSWKIEWTGRWIVVPYIREESGWKLAFKIRKGNIEIDALNLDEILDEEEKNMTIEDRFNYRIVHGYIRYPNTARYLFKFYDQLRNRVYERKRIEEYAGAWYAFHRVRDLDKLLGKPKIITPRLFDKPSFAIDYEGYLPLDSVIALIPHNAFNELKRSISDIIDAKNEDEALTSTLLYVLAFLNSRVTYIILSAGAPRTPKGDYSIDERILQKIVIPKPSILDRENVKRIIELAKAISELKPYDEDLKKELDNVVLNVYTELLNVEVKDLLSPNTSV